MRALICGIVIVVGGGVLAEFASSLTWACAPAPRPGERVTITKEAALIVYDARTRTEHFIRRASFSTSAGDFGFLVPTPTVPELGAVKPGIFDSLVSQTFPSGASAGDPRPPRDGPLARTLGRSVDRRSGSDRRDRSRCLRELALRFSSPPSARDRLISGPAIEPLQAIA